MIDYDAMVENESMADVILFLIGREVNGLSHPSIDLFFGRHKGNEKYQSYNIKLIHEIKNLQSSEKILFGKKSGYGYQKGPNWKAPKFVSEKKYGIE